jgi:hypothetical protein
MKYIDHKPIMKDRTNIISLDGINCFMTLRIVREMRFYMLNILFIYDAPTQPTLIQNQHIGTGNNLRKRK